MSLTKVSYSMITGAPINVMDYGAKGDGVTDDSAAIQAAIDAAAIYSSVPVATTSGHESVGGGDVYFPQTPNGYVVNTEIKIPVKIHLSGPAKLIGAAGSNIFTFVYAGSSAHTMVVVDNLDFIGGTIGVNVGDQAAAFPIVVRNCKFVNQTVAGVKVSNYAYDTSFRDNLFTGCNYGLWFSGDASDGALIDHNVFIYNNNHDVYVQNNNTLRITNNAFVGNLQVPASSVANVYFDTGTFSETGGYTVISNNKFGQEGRTAGNCIYFAGTSGLVQSVVIENNLLHFDSTATNAFAIGFGVKQPSQVIVQNNSLLFCKLIDFSNVYLGGYVGQNSFTNNAFPGSAVIYPSTVTGNYAWIEEIEPPTQNKFNRVQWSRIINDPFFVFLNATPSYMTATDENGVANNATTVTATNSNNFTRLGGVTFDTKYKTSTLSVWVKLSVASTVLFSVSRGTNLLLYKSIQVGTDWQRVTFSVSQTVEINPFLVDFILQNGITATFGGITVVSGRDVGDLIRSNRMIEYYGSGIQSPASPTIENAVYLPISTRVWSSAPIVGQPIGYMCTASGNPGTWSNLANL